MSRHITLMKREERLHGALAESITFVMLTEQVITPVISNVIFYTVVE